MEVICLETKAFYALVEEVVKRIQDNEQIQQDKWLSTEDAMDLLKVKSKTTLQKLRDEGKIRYSQPQKKIILYDRDSILAHLDRNAQNTF
ncbi:helix-turn-helix domain-containing protein [Tunicatimonas pelagia]|uniref:helix-turn-helix domain-containing protein n=1 Tax=Tunicatimonas pelagia TaxID=931531 RepID=UPI0026658FEA|nr:helix-turn-helix domain-containing protein [Tunicatimonas pelagia]WKN45414.1 helix-turn-helix domain-containing protein [Tunicatimonas pelagia]